MKRFYNEVTIDETPEGYMVLLDGRSIKTPSKKLLTLPSQALAQAVADEWAQQGEKVVIEQMLLTRLSYGVLELEASDRVMLRDETLAYITTELLCYRDDERPELGQQQVLLWDAPLAWVRDTLGIALEVTSGIMPVAVSDEAMAKVRGVLEELDDWHLVPFALLVRVLGSFILALMVLHGRINASEAMRLAHLEQDFQALQWGMDEDTHARRAAALREAVAVERVFAALRDV
jgi:chaperone required for assembly of F1-ATPase